MNLKDAAINLRNIFFYKLLEFQLRNCKSVLDVGCGTDSPIGRIKKIFYSEGIDIFKKSISTSKKKKIHDKYILGNIKNLDKYYKPKSFDATIALDVIEHLDKKDGIKMLKQMKKISRKKVIILTPNGFYHQDHLDNNPYQFHRSGWTPHDMEKFGYKVYGLWGIKNIRGEDAQIKYKPWIFWAFVALISEPFVFFFPHLSFDIFAVKKFSDTDSSKEKFFNENASRINK